MRKGLSSIFIVFFAVLSFLCINVYSNAYAQEENLTPIMGESQATQGQAYAFFMNNNNERSREYVNDFVNIVWEEAIIEGVRPDVAFSLMMLETGYLRFGGDVKESQNNFGGIGATGGGEPGNSFPDIRTGIRAVVQHIKAYASTDPLNLDCVDPRFKYVTRGSSEYVEWLGKQENPWGYGWATGAGYGGKIINLMDRMQKTSKPITSLFSLSVTHNNKSVTTYYSHTPYLIKANAVTPNNSLYRFWIGDRATNEWTLIQDYSGKNTVSWTFSRPGRYEIVVHIKDSASTQVYDTYTSFDITVTETTIKSFDLGGTQFYAGKKYTAAANATSGNKPLYKFWVGDPANKTWTVIQDYSEKNTATWSVSKPGKYEVIVHVRDSESPKTYDAYKYYEITAEEIPTTIESFNIGGAEFYAGRSYTATAKAVSVNKPLYKFWVGDPANKTWTVVQDYSESNTATWSVSKPGKYEVIVHVRDSASTKPYDAYKYYEITAEEIPTAIQSFDIEGTEFYAGGSYTAAATAVSANQPLYCFWIGDKTNNKWTLIQDYSKKNTANWSVNEPGKYEVVVHVKDSASKKSYDTYAYYEITAKGTTINSFNLGGTRFYAGLNYTAVANADSANKPQYRFWVGDTVNKKWTIIQDYSEQNSATWSVSTPGNYEIIVHVRDSESTKPYDTYMYYDVIVNIPVLVGKTIVLDAGHGGIDPGAISSPATGSIYESVLNEQQTRILGELLLEYGANVIYTRDRIPPRNSNITLGQDLENRVDVANEIRADLFLSIHHDSAYPNTTANGISTHYSTYRPLLDNEGLAKKNTIYGSDIIYDLTPCEAAIKSNILAEMLVRNIATLGFNICPQENGSGAHDHNLYVTRNTTMPSVLIEAGFMSNEQEVLRVAEKSVQQSIAQKIVDTLIDFYSS